MFVSLVNWITMDSRIKFICGFTPRKNPQPSFEAALDTCVSRECTVLDEHYILDETSSNGHFAKHFVSDVYMLFNQKRLDRMTAQALQEYLLSSNASDDGLHELRNKVPVDKLSEFVKSRYIQSPSELRSWTHYIMSEFRNELNSIQSQQDLNAALNRSSAPASEVSNPSE